jgi:hypothetical protein
MLVIGNKAQRSEPFRWVTSRLLAQATVLYIAAVAWCRLSRSKRLRIRERFASDK